MLVRFDSAESGREGARAAGWASCFVADAEPGLRRLTTTIVGRRDLCLVYMPAAGRNARVRAVIDFIAESMTERVAMLRGDSPVSSAEV